jgi:hypothetical protein
MDITEIKKMLGAFYQGNTSREEEQMLQTFFEGENIPEELRHEQALFRTMFEKEEIKIPAGIENRLASLVDQLEKSGQRKIATTKSHQARRLWLRIGGVAASICLLVSIGLFIQNQRDDSSGITNDRNLNSPTQLTPEDQRKLIQAEKALELVSEKFNKGMEGMESVSENL